MKLKIFHHNGQLAEYDIQDVTHISLEVEDGERPARDVLAANNTFDKLIKAKTRPKAV